MEKATRQYNSKNNIFQSTLPRRERLSNTVFHNNAPFISIHAPAKGATNTTMVYAKVYEISIHAPAKGATCFCSSSSSIDIFQSTLPRRERRYISNWRYRLYHNFNPRSREGSDVSPSYHLHSSQTFQSTLPRRERQQYFTNPQVNIVKH